MYPGIGMGSRRVRRTFRELDEAAKALRERSTPAEAVLWEGLRAKRLGGYKFRRQHPVGRFVLDFYCASQKLCVEADGAVHDGQQERDAARDAVLASYNVRVIRFRNEEILNNVEGVLARILALLDER
ncbi:MAG TPA: DUF559 domain-containing protein [Longimicrobium sp.]|nr:DUF559 domain-containing protein [Longimicrobium sp.]